MRNIKIIMRIIIVIFILQINGYLETFNIGNIVEEVSAKTFIKYNLENTFSEVSSAENFIFLNGAIVKYVGEEEKVVIPDMIDGVIVTQIGAEAFKDNLYIKEVIMPDTISGIYGYSTFNGTFQGCENLESVRLSKNLTIIQTYMFNKCISLEKIDIPDSVTEIGFGAFLGCKSLSEIIIPKNVIYIQNQAFDGCYSLENIELPKSLSNIGRDIIARCYSINSLTINYYDEDISNITIEEWKAQANKIPQISGVNDKRFTIGYVKNNNEIKEVKHEKSSNAYLRDIKVSDGILIPNSAHFKEFNPYVTEYNMEVLNDVSKIVITPIAANSKAIVEGPMSIDLKVGENEVNIPVIAEDGTMKEYKINILRVSESGYLVEDGVIIRYLGSEKDIVIPSMIDGQVITTIGNNAFRDNENITSIVMPNTITKIESVKEGNLAPDCYQSPFRYCTNLKSVKLSEGLTEIPEVLFYGCDSLVDVYIPESVVNIGQGSFQLCKSLENINLPKNLKSIEGYLFYMCSSLEKIELPKNITHIGSYAFYECDSLKFVDIPEGTKFIGERAFAGSHQLEEVKIPDSVTEIGSFAFSQSNNIKRLKLPENLKDIYNRAGISQGVLWIFGKMDELVIPYGIEAASDNNVGICYAKKLEIPTTFKSESESSQTEATELILNYGDKSIENINYETWKSDLKKIGYNLINENVIITGYAKNNSEMKRIKGNISGIESSTGAISPNFSESINKYTIIVSKNIEEITLSLKTTVDDVDVKEPITKKLSLGSNIIELTAVGENGQVFSYTVDVIKENYSDQNRFNVNYGKITGYMGSDTEVIIPPTIRGNKITSIGSNAFKNNTNIKSIEIPDGVTSIDYNAFEGCTNLESVKIPSTVQYIYSSAFKGCSNLRNIELPEGLTSIDSSIFKECTSLKNINIPSTVKNIYGNAFEGCTNLESIEIPSSVVSIYSSAFEGCSKLESVKIQYGLKNIYSYAFYNCNNLKSIEIPKSVTYCAYGAFGYDNIFRKVTIDYGTTNISNVGINQFNDFLINTIGIHEYMMDEVKVGYIKNNKSKKLVKGYKEDINLDGYIDIEDISIMALQYNISSEEDNWNEELDFNEDKIIDIFDIIEVAKKL